MDEFEVLDAVPAPKRKGNGHGGRREGAGAKPADYVKPQEKVDFEVARARSEAAKADMLELDYQIKLGNYISRIAVRQACATAFSSIAQGLRSIPDNVERKFAIPGEVAEQIGAAIDEALADLAAEFELMVGSGE